MDFVAIIVLNTEYQTKVESFWSSVFSYGRLTVLFYQVYKLVQNLVIEGFDVFYYKHEAFVLSTFVLDYLPDASKSFFL